MGWAYRGSCGYPAWLVSLSFVHVGFDQPRSVLILGSFIRRRRLIGVGAVPGLDKLTGGSSIMTLELPHRPGVNQLLEECNELVVVQFTSLVRHEAVYEIHNYLPPSSERGDLRRRP